VLVGAGVVGLIGRAAGFDALGDALSASEPAWLAVCAAGQVVVFAGIGLSFRAAVAFEGGPVIGRRLALRVMLTAFGFSQLIAAAGAASLALSYWALRRLRFSRRDAAVRMIGFQTTVYLVFGLIGWAAALACLVGGLAPLGMTLPWLVGIPILVVAGRWFTEPGRVERWAAEGGGWFRRALSVGVGAAWWTRRALGTRDGRATAAGALAYWAGDVVSLWGGLRAAGAEPGLAALVLAYATGYLASALPIPFIATGGVDAAMTFALHAVGVPLEQALLGVVAHRLFAFWLPIVPALVLAALLGRTARQLDRAGTVAAGARPATR
jgi:uncharacterized membrane protein YbhN (UPF0104 family)